MGFFKVHTVVTMLSAPYKTPGSCVQEKVVLVAWLLTSYNVKIRPSLSLHCKLLRMCCNHIDIALTSYFKAFIHSIVFVRVFKQKHYSDVTSHISKIMVSSQICLRSAGEW